MKNNKELKALALSYCDNLLFQISGNDTDKINNIVYSIIQNKEKSNVLSSLEVIYTLERAFTNTSVTPLSKNSSFKMLTSIPLLIITDVGSTKDNREMEQAYISYIIEKRCDNNLSTIITTSLNKKGITQFLGEDVVDSFFHSWKILTLNKKIYEDSYISSLFTPFTNSSRSNKYIKKIEINISKLIEKIVSYKNLLEKIAFLFLHYTFEDYNDIERKLNITDIKSLEELYNLSFKDNKENEKIN